MAHQKMESQTLGGPALGIMFKTLPNQLDWGT